MNCTDTIGLVIWRTCVRRMSWKIAGQVVSKGLDCMQRLSDSLAQRCADRLRASPANSFFRPSQRSAAHHNNRPPLEFGSGHCNPKHCHWWISARRAVAARWCWCGSRWAWRHTL